MSTANFSCDVAAAAQNAVNCYEGMVETGGIEDAQFNHFDMLKTTKYTMKRLTAARLITDEEEKELDRIIDGAAAGEDVSETVEAIRKRRHASALAVTLANLAVANSRGGGPGKMYGAVIGALISSRMGAGEIMGTGDNARAAGGALASVVAAVSGAAAATAFAVVQRVNQQRQQQQEREQQAG